MDNVIVTITSFFTGGSAPAAAPEPAPPPLPHPFDPQEEPLPLKQKLICAALSPLILIFAVVRGLLFAFLVIFYSGCSALAIHGLPPPDKSAGFFEPLRGFRRHLLRFAAYCVGRSILLTLGVWPGLLNVRGEWDPSCPVCIAAPHVGASDAFLFVTLGLPRPVILEPYSKICFVRQILQGCGALLVPIVSAGSKAQTEGKEKGSSSQTNAVRETILAHKRTFEPSSSTCCNDSAPITLFSEGITHAGCALLPSFRAHSRAARACSRLSYATISRIIMRRPSSRRLARISGGCSRYALAFTAAPPLRSARSLLTSSLAALFHSRRTRGWRSRSISCPSTNQLRRRSATAN